MTADCNLMASFDYTDVVGKLRVRACRRVAGIAVDTATVKPLPSAPAVRLTVLPLPTSVKLTPRPAQSLKLSGVLAIPVRIAPVRKELMMLGAIR